MGRLLALKLRRTCALVLRAPLCEGLPPLASICLWSQVDKLMEMKRVLAYGNSLLAAVLNCNTIRGLASITIHTQPHMARFMQRNITSFSRPTTEWLVKNGMHTAMSN
jgi:hypothetical protein